VQRRAHVDDLRGTDDLHKAAQALIDEANEAGGRDNITVVLFRVEEVGADAPVEQPTAVGMKPVAPAEVAAVAAAATPAVAPPPAPAQRRMPRLARKQGRAGPATVGASAPAGKQRRFGKPLAALVAVLVVLFLVGGGGYLASRQLYFIGTNSQGVVTIFRGLPYDLPGGIHLYETFYVSGVPASQVPTARRGTLLNHNLRSQTDAAKLVHALELGQIIK
jgi:protein phosphatase